MGTSHPVYSRGRPKPGGDDRGVSSTVESPMVDVAARLVYRASELNSLLAEAPSLVAMAHSDPRIDPAYLFLRAEAKQRGPVAAVVFDHGQVVGCLYAVEDCIRGTRSGLFSIGDRTGAGILLASPANQRLVFHHGLRALLCLARIHTIHIHALSEMFGREGLATAIDEVGDYQSITAQHSQYTLPSRLRLLDSWNAFLATVGPDTRRNLRRYPARAAESGVVFVPEIDAATFARAFDSLRPHALRWDGLDPRDARGHARDAIRVGLHSPDHGWLSVLAGWRHGDRAFIATQMNHGGMPQLSLSMVLRASLIQALIARGVREMVFLDGCAGALQLSCIEEPIDRARIEVHTALADLSRGALRVLWPRLAHRIFRDEPAPLRWRPRSRTA